MQQAASQSLAQPTGQRLAQHAGADDLAGMIRDDAHAPTATAS